MENFRPVFLESDRCNGCVNCMKRCPTEAIRVRGGKAEIMYERCIGCGECVKVCPTRAKREYYDKIEEIKRFKYTVAVPSPSVYGQFKHQFTDTNLILNGIKRLGFDDVMEAAEGAEYVSAATVELLKKQTERKLVISSACPAVVNLILMRYEHLADYLSPVQQPEEVAANLARAKAEMETDYKGEEIGVFVITQCAANVMQLKESPDARIDGVLSVKELYFQLLHEINELTASEDTLIQLATATRLGVSWGSTTGEAMGLKTDNFLAADGIENVIRVLEDVEHDKLKSLDFIELYACTQGCVGGSMNVESPFLARTRLRRLRNKLPLAQVSVKDFGPYTRKNEYRPNNVFKFSDDRATAMKMTLEAKDLYARLPGINCGSCGAPSCMAFAEDKVKGRLKGAVCKYIGKP
ncbi:MAG: 4Fe-4S dicluster domain-containing protein [Clostridiales bacterium]|nr:4Fe-4S dicluster domain-containing protein [Clostridiales bacterium]